MKLETIYIETYVNPNSGTMVYRCPRGRGVVEAVEAGLVSAGIPGGVMVECAVETEPGVVIITCKRPERRKR